MAFNKFSFQPEDGFLDSGYYEDSPVDSRQILQRQHNQTRDYINGVIDRLNNKKEGESGAESIASPHIDGVNGENIFSQVKDIKRQLSDATAGKLTDNSVSSDKLASGSVTKEKIAEGNVESKHFAADAIAPFSKETYNMNGYSADMFEPVFKNSPYGIFKERVTDSAVLNARGKIYKGYRYFLNNKGVLSKMSMEDYSVSEYLDLSAYTKNDMAYSFDENDDLYIVSKSSSAGGTHISIYKYENGDITYINMIKISGNTKYYNVLNDILCYGGNMYIGLYQDGEYPACYLYKIPLKDLYTTSEVAAFYSGSCGSNIRTCDIFVVNGDLYFYKWRLKNIDSNSGLVYSWVFKGYGEGKFLVEHENAILTDENILPVFVSSGDVSSVTKNSFIYENYLYSVICGYLFRTRLF